MPVTRKEKMALRDKADIRGFYSKLQVGRPKSKRKAPPPPSDVKEREEEEKPPSNKKQRTVHEQKKAKGKRLD